MVGLRFPWPGLGVHALEAVARTQREPPRVELRFGQGRRVRYHVGAQDDAFDVGVERPALVERGVGADLAGRADAVILDLDGPARESVVKKSA